MTTQTIAAVSVAVCLACAPADSALTAQTRVVTAIVRDEPEMDVAVLVVAKQPLVSIAGMTDAEINGLEFRAGVIVGDPKQEPRCVETEKRPPGGCVALWIRSYEERGDTAHVTVFFHGVDVGGVQDVRMDTELAAYVIGLASPDPVIMSRTTLVGGHE